MNTASKLTINPDDPMLHIKVLRAHGYQYWHHFYIGSFDWTLTLPAIFISGERAKEAIQGYSKQCPDIELCVFERKVHISRLPEFNTPLEDIKCPYTREFHSIYRELISINASLVEAGITPIEVSTHLAALPLFEAHYSNQNLNAEQRLSKLIAWHKSAFEMGASDHA